VGPYHPIDIAPTAEQTLIIRSAPAAGDGDVPLPLWAYALPGAGLWDCLHAVNKLK